MALPANQAMPKAVSKMPKAVLRLSGGTTADSTAFKTGILCAHANSPKNHRDEFQRGSTQENQGRKKGGNEKGSEQNGSPSLSNNSPRTKDATAPDAMATA